MRIGVNTLFLIPSRVGGTETYARGLLAALEKINKNDDFFVFCNKENFKTFKFQSSSFKKILYPINASFRPLRILWEQLVLPFQVWRRRIDVLLSLGYVCPLFVPCTSIVFIYDLNWFFHPKEFSFFQRLAWKTLVSLSAKRATYIITSSRSSGQDIAKILKVPKGRIVVVYGGVDKERFRPIKNKLARIKKGYGLGGKFILTVSASYHFKNLERLVEAFSEISRKFPNLKLLVVGLAGKAKPEILAKIKKYRLKKKVILSGFIPDEDLPLLYSAAEIYIHPSLYEGFGFPVLEAMASGTPVVSSKAASLPELIGRAGILIDAQKRQEIIKALGNLLLNTLLARKMAAKGIVQSKKFTWRRAAEKTLKICQEK